MLQVKRHLSISEFSEKKAKKLQTTFDDRKIISCFESLPNELYYEIFDYLEGSQLYKAFLNLNIRFQNLLTYASLRIAIDFGFYSEALLQYWFTHIVNPSKHQIVSLRLIDFVYYDSSSTLFSIDSSFSRLESLVLGNITSNKLIPILIGLICLPRLFSLAIDCFDEPAEIAVVYQIIFNFPMLKYYKLSFSSFETFISLPMAANQQFSGIEYLVIDHCCTLNALIAILSYTPRLCRLSCTKVNESDETIVKESFNMISNLTHISIATCFAEFDQFKIFIMKISPQLQILRISCSIDAMYLDADRWEQIISRYLPQLRIFEFKYEETIDEDFEVTPYHGLINRFNSSFWTKQKWLFKISIDTDFWDDNVIIYSIVPYKKTQINVQEDNENDRRSINYANHSVIEQDIISNELGSYDSPLVFSETNQLTIIDHANTDNNEPFIDIIGPILTTVQITCLIITYRHIFIGTLIDLIQYLPNLDSLMVQSLAMVYPRSLSVEELIALRLVSNNNKTTKVSLQRMTDLVQVQFLLDLCPRMRYLEVDCTNGVFPETFVRFILMKNIKYIPNLSLLCLRIPQTTENIVHKLKEMIDLEQLRHHYTIKQIDNRIYLRWN